jgi:hypothetical protein
VVSWVVVLPLFRFILYLRDLKLNFLREVMDTIVLEITFSASCVCFLVAGYARVPLYPHNLNGTGRRSKGSGYPGQSSDLVPLLSGLL